MKKLKKLQNKVSRRDFKDLLGPELLQQNQERLEKLIKYGKDGELVPVLGTGLSSVYKLPTWNKLTGALFPIGFENRNEDSPYVKAFNNIPNHEYIQSVVQNGIVTQNKGDIVKPPTINDPLEYAEYIRLATKQSEITKATYTLTDKDLEEKVEPDFRIKVQNALISHWQACDKSMKKEEIFEHYIKPFVEKNKGTALSHIANFVWGKSMDVITYNFDVLLEMLLEIKSNNDPNINKPKWHSISNSDQMRKYWFNEDINIYHVHGKIEFGKDVDIKNDGQLIFAEKQYYAAEHYLYDWIHAIQADQIHKKHLMFIGFSGQDYNFKRIFKNLSEEKGDLTSPGHECAHYIFLPLEDFISGIKIGPEIHDSENILKGIVNVTMYMKELYLNSHGLYPIWICYDKLNDYMKELEKGILK